MELYILLILSSLGFISANKFIFKTCPSDKGTINDVTSEPCVKSGNNECAFQEGNTQIMNITFTPDIEITEARFFVTAFLGKLEIPYELPNGSVCEYGLSCPLKPKEPQIFQTRMVMNFPPLSLIVQFVLKDSSNNTYGCFKAPVTIVPRDHTQNQMPNQTYESDSKSNTGQKTLEKKTTDNQPIDKLPTNNQSIDKLPTDNIDKLPTDNPSLDKSTAGNLTTASSSEESSEEDLSDKVTTTSNINNQSQNKTNLENSQLSKEENGSQNNTDYQNNQPSQTPVNQRNQNVDDKTKNPHPVETQNNDK